MSDGLRSVYIVQMTQMNSAITMQSTERC